MGLREQVKGSPFGREHLLKALSRPPGPLSSPGAGGRTSATAGADTYGWTSRPRASLQPE
jgi:hypothetical protein